MQVVTMQGWKSKRKRRIRNRKAARQGLAKRLCGKMFNTNQLKDLGGKEQLIAVQTMNRTFEAWSWKITQVGWSKSTLRTLRGFAQKRMAIQQRIWSIFSFLKPAMIAAEESLL